MEEKMNRIDQDQISSFSHVFRAVVTVLCLGSVFAVAQSIGPSHTITTIASTVPANGDINPYGIVVVPQTIGKLIQGNLLISNFNASSNFQGTGTTIVQISPSGHRTLFAHIDADHLPVTCTGGVGLTTALVALRSGWVIVGSLPTSDGTSATAQAGCLLVLDSSGRVVESIYGGLIKGPWDMTALDGDEIAVLFVTNVLNELDPNAPKPQDTATVVRVLLDVDDSDKPRALLSTVIGSG